MHLACGYKTISTCFCKYFQRCQWYFVKIGKTFSWSSRWTSSRCVGYIDFIWISFSGFCSTWTIVALLMKSISVFDFYFSPSSFFCCRESKICLFIHTITCVISFSWRGKNVQVQLKTFCFHHSKEFQVQSEGDVQCW